MSGMKSAYELAMERFGGEAKELTDEQKDAIADIDARAKARIAETTLTLDQQIATASDPATASLAEQTKLQQIAKIKAEAEAEKEAIRKG